VKVKEEVNMVRKLFALLFACVLVFGLSTPVFAQEGGAKPAEGKAMTQDRVEGVITRSNKDKSTLVVRNRDTNVEKTVQYDSSTQWTSQEHHSKTVNNIDASQVKDDDRVICLGTFDKEGILHAASISKRLSK
jgi:alpha-L-fucosidase